MKHLQAVILLIALLILVVPVTAHAQVSEPEQTGSINYYDPAKGQVYWSLVEDDTATKEEDVVHNANGSFTVSNVDSEQVDPKAFPIKVYQKQYDENGVPTADKILYQTAQDLTKNASVSIANLDRYVLDNGQVYVKFGAHSVTYSGVTNVITFDQNSTDLFEDIYNADVAGGWNVFNKCTASGTASSCYCSHAKILIDGLHTIADTNCSITFIDGIVGAGESLLASNNSSSNVTFGSLDDAVNYYTSDGVVFISNEQSNGHRLCDGWISYYSCVFKCPFGSSAQVYNIVDGYNCTFQEGSFPYSVRGFLYNCSVSNSAGYGIGLPRTGSTYSQVRLTNCSNGIYLNQSLTFNDSSFYNCTHQFYPIELHDTVTFLNPYSDTAWSFVWGGGSTGTVTFSYTYDLTVTDYDGNPVIGADVYLIGLTSGTIASLTTSLIGTITQQQIDISDYNLANGNTAINVENPLIIRIEAPGFEYYTGQFTLNQAIVHDIALAESGTHETPYASIYSDMANWWEDNMYTMLLGLLPLILTFLMFHTRNMVLGFPSGIFWAILGSRFYQLSDTTWDLNYDLFFACFGMCIFSIYAAFGLRKRDLNPKESDWLDSESFLDERRERRKTEKLATEFYGDDMEEWEDYHSEERIDKPSGRSQGVRQRAADRRSGVKSRKTDYRGFR